MNEDHPGEIKGGVETRGGALGIVMSRLLVAPPVLELTTIQELLD